MEIKHGVELLVILAALVVILYCLPIVAFKAAAYVLLFVWVAEVVIFAPVAIRAFLDRDEGDVAK